MLEQVGIAERALEEAIEVGAAARDQRHPGGRREALVASLLAGQRAVEEQRHLHRHRLGQRHAAGLGDDEIGGRHEAMHGGDEAEDAQRRAGREPLERRAQSGVVAGHEDADERMANAGERAGHVWQAPDRAPRARHRQDDGNVDGQSQRAADLARRGRARELGAHRHAGHHDALARNAARDEVVTDLVRGDAVAIDARRDPLAVGDEVRDDGGVRRQAPARAGERGHGHRMRGVHGHDGVGRDAVQQGAKPSRAQARSAEGQRRVTGQAVTEGIREAPHSRQVAQQCEVGGTRRAVEERVHEVTEMVDDDRVSAEPGHLPGDAAGSLVVARAIRSGEDQDAAHRPILPWLDRPGPSE